MASRTRLPFYDDPMATSSAAELDDLMELMAAQCAARRRERDTREQPKAKKSKIDSVKREAKRKIRMARWESTLVYTAPPSVVKGRKHKHTDCCQLNCTQPYEDAPEALVKLRKYFQALPETGRTEFISRRLRARASKQGVNCSRKTGGKEYFLESADFLCNRVLRTNALPPENDTVRLGCKASFLWLLGVSSDKVVQPTNASATFSTVSGDSLRQLNAGVSEKTEKAIE